MQQTLQGQSHARAATGTHARQMNTQLDDTGWSWTCRIATAVKQLKSNDEDEIWVKLSQCHLRDSKAKQVGPQSHEQPHSKQPCTTSSSPYMYIYIFEEEEENSRI